MKRLYMIGGTMGIGKTTVSQYLKTELNNSVFLDGDWCWDMHPFHVTEETKEMVMRNICTLLNNFIKCSAIENIIFCWVMDKQDIINDILSRLIMVECRGIVISLVCSEDELKKRLKRDINSGVRNADILQRSIERLPLYKELDTIKIDVSKKTIKEIKDVIVSI